MMRSVSNQNARKLKVQAKAVDGARVLKLAGLALLPLLALLLIIGRGAGSG